MIKVLREQVLGSGMGASFLRVGDDERQNSLAPVALWLAAYAAGWVAISILPGSESPELVSLLAWGVFYFAAAIYLAQTATQAVIHTVEMDIAPHARPEYIEEVTKGLRRRYPHHWTLRRAAPPALISLALAVWAISEDLELGLAESSAYTPDLLFWAATYFLYFLTAAMSVDATRFYMEFARQLEEESDSFYVLGAADTPLVRGLAKLANQVLAFHSLIFLLLASAMLLAVVPFEGYRLPANSWLLLVMVPTSCFFSLGVGTLVFIGTELKIRGVLQRFALRHAARLQEESNRLLNPTEGIIAEKAEELKRLTDWQDRILAGGRYGSRLGTVISIALPFLVPLLGGLISIFFEGSGSK